MNPKRLLALALLLPALCSLGQPISGTWHGQLALNALRLNLVFHFSSDSLCTLDSPDQNALGIPGTVKERSAEKVSVLFMTLGGAYNGQLQDGKLVGTFRQMGHELPLTLVPGELVRRRPQAPQPPFPYETHEVTFAAGPDSTAFLASGDTVAAPITLAGTLTLPATSPTSCVLMVTGSGLQNRDEELFEHKPFAIIADYLARHGIASLRYDDRGFGQSTGDPTQATTLDFAHDAEAGLAYLRSLNRFSHIGVLGHSEGGAIAFMLAAERDNTPFTVHPDFLVTLAAPGIKGDTLIVEQTNALLRQSGKPATMTRKQLHLTMLMQGTNPWYEFFVEYDPADDIQATRCPVLALNGSLDKQVLPESNLAAIHQLSTLNPHLSTKEYPGLNHLFQHAMTGAPTEYGIIEETISEEVLHDIADWISSLK